MKRSNILCLPICLAAGLLWLSSVSELHAVSGGVIKNIWTRHYTPGDFVWNTYDIHDEVDFKVTIRANASTPNGNYGLQFWKYVPWSKDRINFQVLSGVVTIDPASPAYFVANDAGPWSIQLGGPQTYKDATITYTVDQQYISSGTYGYGMCSPTIQEL